MRMRSRTQVARAAVGAGVALWILGSDASAQAPNDCLSRLPTDRVTLNLREASIQTTLRLLAQQYKINMLVTEDVKGLVTLDFFRVPARDVFQALIDGGGLRCVVAGDVLRVSTLARLRAEPLLAIPAVEELLRYDSPVQILSGRCAPDDLTIAGFDLSDGQRVLAMVGAANRDAAVFSDPDRLILDRAQQAPLSFGGGIHYCLGAPLARLEAQVALPALLARFPRLALAGEPVWREGGMVHGHASLPITAR